MSAVLSPQSMLIEQTQEALEFKTDNERQLGQWLSKNIDNLGRILVEKFAMPESSLKTSRRAAVAKGINTETELIFHSHCASTAGLLALHLHWHHHLKNEHSRRQALKTLFALIQTAFGSHEYMFPMRATTDPAESSHVFVEPAGEVHVPVLMQYINIDPMTRFLPSLNRLVLRCPHQFPFGGTLFFVSKNPGTVVLVVDVVADDVCSIW